jgi:hypothetical protein
MIEADVRGLRHIRLKLYVAARLRELLDVIVAVSRNISGSLG